MASNAFWRSNGRFQGLVDLERQIYFDGSNLVTIRYDATAGIKIDFKQKVLQDAALKMKVVAVFGPAQGFVDEWVGFASDAGFRGGSSGSHLYWVYIDPATGVVDSTRIYRLSAESMPCYWYTTPDGTSNPCPSASQNQTNRDRIPEFTPYNVNSATSGTGKRLIGLGGVSGAGMVNLTFVEGADRKVIVGPSRAATHTYDHMRAILNGHRLYYTASFYDGPSSGGFDAKMFYYDADADAAATNSDSDPYPAIAPGAGTTPNYVTDHAQCAGGTHFGLIQLPSATGPSMLYCRADSRLQLTTFTDFTLATAAANATLPVFAPFLITGTNQQDTRDFIAGIVNSYAQLIACPLDAGTVAVGLAKPSEVRVVDPVSGDLKRTTPFRQLATEGRLEFSWIFAPGASTLTPLADVMTVAAWTSDTLFLCSQEAGGSFASYLLNLGTRARTRLTGLDGMALTSAVRLNADTVLASGYEPATGKPVSLTLGNDGEALKSTDASVIIKDVALRGGGG